jgi:hypothetical protein
MENKSWYEVNRKGLAKLLEKRGKAFALFELIQNAWDTGATKVQVSLEPIPNRAAATLVVTDDDPDGFADLSHAYTLFAESEKKSDPTKRGRFNLGEKLVLALCNEATITSTKGCVRFEATGQRTRSKKRRDRGSEFRADIRITREELIEVEEQFSRLIPPLNVQTSFNGDPLPTRDPIATFETKLKTKISDEEGNLKDTVRKTQVRVYKPLDGETPTIYEMGIPVVELEGDAYHVDVQQKVPVNMDRDNVTPGYLRKLRVEVLNHTRDLLTKEDTQAAWVTDALTHDDIADEAVNTVLDHRYGKKRAIYDPSDIEANQQLVSEGYAVIHGRSLPKEAWGNVKRSGAAKPSGTLRPTPTPYSPNGSKMAEFYTEEDLTEDMRRVRSLAKGLALEVLGHPIHVRFNRSSRNFAACYGNDTLDFAVCVLGKRWFRKSNLQSILDLLIHEFAHDHESSHLSDRFHKACTEIGSKIAMLALEQSETFTNFLE